MDDVKNISSALNKEVSNFLSIINTLIADLYERFPNDSMLHRVKNRINIAVRYDPIAVIDMVGFYIFRYREKIYARDVSFFIRNDYDKELKEGVDQEKTDAVHYFIPKVKEAWLQSDKRNKILYLNMIENLLHHYTEYLIYKRELTGRK